MNSGWTRGAFARDGSSRVVYWDSRVAVRFCLLGAVRRASRRPRQSWSDGIAVEHVVMKAVRSFDVSSLSSWNDKPGRKKSEVIALLDSLIAEYKAKAKK